ncbi:DUF4282 domain-containing protein [Sinimarinibacterium sp. CAU 1509]|uniref:DUF4282 domain-containing protein n=1 Tax=Sinimarinibacterium sp. CAU 1509 TaxID=2562283 RepID=UPI0010AC54FF|nr:DUF4282 domain-containing protein [Sinimarinibacterium sp. CAU 1509]TJY56661.1 DUF4282 domain-containing protein [Sinimarinibacterium sp. CAU 1509]
MSPEDPTRLTVSALLDSARDFLRSLLDLRFEQLITPRMLPTLYMLAIAASAYGMLTYAIGGFTQSLAVGLFRLLLVAPVGFVVLVTLCRIGLEFLMVVFRLAVNVSEMAGHTGDIASGLPRIQFWKGLLGGSGKPRPRE